MSPNTTTTQGRFLPGAVLVERYRIVALLGSGGMGEVYRADDLKLGETVALKFLPERFEHDASLRQRLLDEARNARQVAHPNICRVYDVGEADGRLFLTMEYVDGEDLGSLLRRIGRLPPDKAVQIARELCAGLQAVHEAGILHRDLKPSNVMLDGRGRARIADFGVAALADRDEGFGGTPAYVAPEQLRGSSASVATDVYALGLVLYETFTGKPAFGAASGDGLAYLKQNTTPTPPTSITPDTDPAVERAIMRCLDTDPGRRPPSAAHVAASLPGADPLAAALAAGETPSPELVAGVADAEAVRPAVAWGLFGGVLLLLTALFVLAPGIYLVQRAHIDKPPEVLVDRALEIRHELGYTDRIAGIHSRFIFANDIMRENLRRLGARRGLDETIANPSVLFTLMVRTSPAQLLPRNGLTLTPGQDDPPPSLPGMCDLWIDGRGRLTRLRAVAPRFDSLGPRDPADAFRRGFALAGLPMERFLPVAPRHQPVLYTDARGAWSGVHPDRPGSAVRVEMAAANGRLVSMTMGEEERRDPTRDRPPDAMTPQEVFGVLFAVLLFLLIVGCVLVARRHLAQGRADARGTFRIAIALAIATTALALLTSSPTLRAAYIGTALGIVIFTVSVTFAMTGVLYLTLEPIVRRTWPEALVSWIRLLEGRLRDPRVGRDVLLGLVSGLAVSLALVVLQWAWSLTSWPQPVSSRFDNAGVQTDVLSLGGWPWATLLGSFTNSLQFTLIFTSSLALLTRISGRRWVGLAAAITVSLFWTSQGIFDSGYSFLDAAIPSALFAVLFHRVGLLAVAAMMFSSLVMKNFPLEPPFASWYWNATVVGVGGLLVVGFWAFLSAFGGRPVFSLPDEAKLRP